MSADQDSPQEDEIKPLPPSAEQQAAHGRAMAEAMKQAKGERGARLDKELKAMDKLNAKYGKRAEKAAAKLGLDQKKMQADLKALADAPEDQIEQRMREFADRYRPLQEKVLKESGIDSGTLRDEALGTVEPPDKAKVHGRRGKGAGGNIGWSTEEAQS